MTEPKPTKENIEIGKRIKAIRLSLGKDVRSFGSMIQPPTSGSVVSRWERGVNKPNAQRLQSIAELGNTTTDYLLTGNFVDKILIIKKLEKYKDDENFKNLTKEQQINLYNFVELSTFVGSSLIYSDDKYSKSINAVRSDTFDDLGTINRLIQMLIINDFSESSAFKNERKNYNQGLKEFKQVKSVLDDAIEKLDNIYTSSLIKYDDDFLNQLNPFPDIEKKLKK